MAQRTLIEILLPELRAYATAICQSRDAAEVAQMESTLSWPRWGEAEPRRMWDLDQKLYDDAVV